MRTKLTRQEYLDFGYESSLKVVKQYRAKYKALGKILEANPHILDLAHQDFSRLLSTSKSLLALSGPCAAIMPCSDMPPGSKPPCFASYVPVISPMHSFITLR